MKNIKVALGSISLLVGVFMLSTSYNFTGFVVTNNETVMNYSGTFVGIGLIIIGLFLILFGKEK